MAVFHWWVLLMLLAYHGAVLVGDIKLLFYYEHPEDSKYNHGILAKINVLICLQFSWHIVSGLPTDVYNTAFDAGFNTQLFWELSQLFVLMYVSFPLPFSAFYYEADADLRAKKTAAWKKGLIYAIVIAVLTYLSVVVFWVVLKKFEIEMPPGITLEDYCSTYPRLCTSVSIPPEERILHQGCKVFFDICKPTDRGDVFNCEMEFLQATTLFLCTICYFPFSLFLSIGFVALPFDLIFGFIERPKAIDFKTYMEKKQLLAHQAGELRNAGSDLKQREIESRILTGIGGTRSRLQIAREMKKFRQSAFLLEEEYRDLNISMKERGENPALSYAKLASGIVCAIVSITWILHLLIHVCIFSVIPEDRARLVPDLLGQFFCWLSSLRSYFLELVLFGAFQAYLLICIGAGFLKFTMRFFVCCAIHPMKKEDTHLGSFLMNASLILLSSTVIPHFCSNAFRGYTDGTAAEVNDDILLNLRIIGVVFRGNFFVWFIIVWSFVTLIYLLVRPRDKLAIELADESEGNPHISDSIFKKREQSERDI